MDVDDSADNPQRFAANVKGLLDIVATMDPASADKKIEIDVPTGWRIAMITALADTEPIGDIELSPIAQEYENAVTSVTVAPDAGPCRFGNYGTVVGDDWQSQKLAGYSTKTYGGKVTYTLHKNAGTVKLQLALVPEPVILTHDPDGTEEMPPVTVTLTHDDDVLTSKLESVATSIACQRLTATSTNLSVVAEDQATRFYYGARINGHNATTKASTQTMLCDEYTYTITYPEGVYFDRDATDNKKWGIIDPDPLKTFENPNGGGQVTFHGNNSSMTHNSNVNSRIKLWFYAKTGEGVYPEEARTWKPGETITLSMNGTVTRNGVTRDLIGTKTSKRKLIDGSGEYFDIAIHSTTRTRRDLTSDFEGFEKGYTLVASPVTTERPQNNGMGFLLKNRDDALGLTALNLAGKNIKDITITTFVVDEDGNKIEGAGHTYTYASLDGEGNVYHTPVLNPNLPEGEYISTCKYTADIPQENSRGTNYWCHFTAGGIGGYGVFINGQEGGIDIAVLKPGSDEPAMRAIKDESGTVIGAEPITGYADVKIGHLRTGIPSITNRVSNKRDGALVNAYTPGQTLYYRSTLYVVNSIWDDTPSNSTQNTIINPSIIIAVPEGVELKPDTVTAVSPAGNHGSEEFSLHQDPNTPPWEATRNGVKCTLYKYVADDPLDLIAEEAYIAPEARRKIDVRWEATVKSDCPESTFYMMDEVFWDIKKDTYQYALFGASDGCGYRVSGIGVGHDVAGGHQPNNTANQYFVIPKPGLKTYLAISPDESGDRWYTYNGADSSIALVQEGKEARVELRYQSTVDTQTGAYIDTDIYLPIPKAGKSYTYLTNIADDPINDTPDVRQFAFDAYLTGPVNMYGEGTGWTTLYAVEAADNPTSPSEWTEPTPWEPVKDVEWLTEDQVSDWSQVVMVKFHAKDNIDPGKGGSAIMNLLVSKDAEFDTVDYWRAYCKHKLEDDPNNNWESTSVIAATPTSAALLGQFFIDEDLNAKFDDSEDPYTDGNYTAVLNNDDIGSIALTVNPDGTFEAKDGDLPIYLRKGEYTITITKGAAEKVYGYEMVESSTASSADGWYNDIKNANVSGAVATYKFDVTESGAVVGDTFVPKIYYAGVGLADTIDIPVTKIWDDADNQDGIRPNNSITVKLLANGDDTGKTLVIRRTQGWKGTFEHLPRTKNHEEITYSVVEVPITGYTPNYAGTQKDGFTITNKHEPEQITITGKKIWEDFDNKFQLRPDSITINLKDDRGEQVATKSVTADDNWEFEFTVPKYRKYGTEVTYSITEAPVAGYDTNIEGNQKDGFVVTNSLQTVGVTLTKTWVDYNNAAGDRPTTAKYGNYLVLKQGDQTLSVTPVVSAGEVSNTYVVTWDDLPKTDAQGKDIEYLVEETTIPNYTSSDVTKVESEDEDYPFAFEVTNTRDTGALKVDKTTYSTEGNENTQFTFTVTLKTPDNKKTVSGTFGGVKFTKGKATVKASNGSPKTIDGIPSGVRYTVTETTNADFQLVEPANNSVAGAIAKDDTVMASFVNVGLKEIVASKIWDDDNDSAELRPSSVTLQLWKSVDGGTAAAVADSDTAVNADVQWQHSFGKLPTYEKVDGTYKPVTYGMRELRADNSVVEPADGGAKFDSYYLATYSDDTLTVTNKAQVKDVVLTKTWVDLSNVMGDRPTVAQYAGYVHLVVDEEPVAGAAAVTTKTGDNEYTVTWSKLPETDDNGETIAYAVTEDAIANYATEGVKPGSDAYHFEVTNTRDTGSLKVGKTTYTTEGDATTKFTFTVKLTKPNSTEALNGTFDGVEFTDGKATIELAGGETKEIKGIPTLAEYAVTEAANEYFQLVEPADNDGVASGAIAKDEAAEASFVNVRLIDVNVTKAWDDENDHDGLRPTEVTFQLWKSVDGGDAAAVDGKDAKLDEASQWKATFTKLPTYEKDGDTYKAVAYSVRELDASGQAIDPKGGDYDPFYKASYKETASTHSFEVTNKHELLTMDVDFSKVGRQGQSVKLNPVTGSKFALWTDATHKTAFTGLPAGTDQVVATAANGTVVFEGLPYNVTLNTAAQPAAFYMTEVDAAGNFLENGTVYKLVLTMPSREALVEDMDTEGTWTLAVEGTPDRETGYLTGTGAEGDPYTIENRPQTGKLIIEKKLDSYETSSDHATFGYTVVATYEGETVYTNAASIDFSAPGTNSVTLEGIPVGAEVTVTEAYNGSTYKKVDGDDKVTTILADDAEGAPATVTFENDYEPDHRGGYGVQNTFVKDADGKDGSWVFSDQAAPEEPETQE